MNRGKTILALAVCAGALVFFSFRLMPTLKSPDTVMMTQPFTFPPLDPDHFTPMQVVPPMPAITNAPVVSVAKSTRDLLDDELVLGVELHGKSRAYPINMLTGPSREVINDRLGGEAIIATW